MMELSNRATKGEATSVLPANRNAQVQVIS